MIFRAIPTAKKEDAIAKLPRVSAYFPEQWKKIEMLLTKDEIDNLEDSAYQRLIVEHDKDLAVEMVILNTLASAVNPTEVMLNYFRAHPDMCLRFAQIYIHYTHHNFFLEKTLAEILERIDGKRIEVIFIHGARDLNCVPAVTCIPLHTKIEGATLKLIEGAGHLQSEPGIQQALLETAEKLKKTLLRKVNLERVSISYLVRQTPEPTPTKLVEFDAVSEKPQNTMTL